MREYIVLLGAVVSMFGCITYIRSMLHGQVKPNRVSWMMWSIAPLIGTAAAFSTGVTWAVLPVFMAGFAPLIVFIFSFIAKEAYWRSTAFDYVCGIFSALALIGWAVTKNPAVAIVFSIVADLTAGIPTLKKGWLNPETEGPGPYAGGLFNEFTGFAAVQTWNFPSTAFLIYLVFYNITMLGFMYRRKFKLSSTA